MYPGGTWHPPPVDLRHRATSSDHADASDGAFSPAAAFGAGFALTIADTARMSFEDFLVRRS
jgi:hypothetical protein